MKRVFLTDDYCRELVRRRMVALDYAIDDLSGIQEFPLNGGGFDINLDPNFIPLAPGETTGGAFPLPPDNAGLMLPPVQAGVAGSSWLSGIAGIGTAITGIFRAIDPPKPGTTLYNPATGLPYGVDPRTGRPVVAAQTQSMITIAFWVLLAIFALRLLSGKV